MTEATAISCPSCGAGLGPLEGDQYRCTYCGHASLPPRPVVHESLRDEMLKSLLHQYEHKRTDAGNARRKARQAEHDALQSRRRTNALVMYVMGIMFMLGCIPCFIAAANMHSTKAIKVNTPKVHGRSVVPPIVIPGQQSSNTFPIVFGFFWLALGGGLFYIGVRYGRAGARDKRLREQGVRGSAVIRSYKRSEILVDGVPLYELSLEVDVPGRPRYVVKQRDYVVHSVDVSKGADLPVFVDPDNPQDVMVDWFTTL